MKDINLFFLITLPAITGFILLLFGEKPAKKNIALSVFLLSFAFSLVMFFKTPPEIILGEIGGFPLRVGLDSLSKLILVFVNLFGVLICLYSKYYMGNKSAYFSYLVWLAAACNLEVLAADLILFLW